MQRTLNEKINVLVMGSGAREHAITEAVMTSPLLGKIFQADREFPKFGEEIKYENLDDLSVKCVEKSINLVIVGPEEPICEGVADVLKEKGINCIAVNKSFSRLESSKLFAKKFMEKHGIKTPKYTIVDNRSRNKCGMTSFPVVIKADGLCKGKGVVIANNEAFAQKTIDEFLDGKFGEASKTILLEEFIDGQELSLMSLWDGKNLLDFVPSRDFKKLNKSPCAPNTGGMGAYCPVKLTQEQRTKLNEYKTQLKQALTEEKADFVGFIYSGLIWSKGQWFVLEYNVRLGDPETQAILTHLKTDFLTILKSAVNQELDTIKPEYKGGHSACLVVATQGYPKAPKDGEKLEFEAPYGLKLFYAGVENKDGELFSKGGRVLSLCTTGDSPFAVLKHFAKRIKLNNKYFRDDLEIE